MIYFGTSKINIWSDTFLFFTQIYGHYHGISRSNDNELINLYDSYIDVRKQIGKAILSDCNKQLFDSLSSISLSLHKELMSKSDEYKLVENNINKNFNYDSIRYSLEHNEAVIEIFRFPKYNPELVFLNKIYYGTLIITKKDTIPVFVYNDNGNELEDFFHSKVRKYFNFNSIQEGYINTYGDKALRTKDYIRFLDREQVHSDLISIHDKFWKPIQDELDKIGGINKIYFSPDGIYHKINISSLEYEKDKYVGDKVDIVYITSARELAKKGKTKSISNRSAVLFGNPRYDLSKDEYAKLSKKDTSLFSSDLLSDDDNNCNFSQVKNTERSVKEIESILKQNGWETKKYIREEALEERLKQIENPGILHIATHGFYNPDCLSNKANSPELDSLLADNPMYKSGLAFAGANTVMKDEMLRSNYEDGLLTAEEAMLLRLRETDLVVLEACNTGLGDIKEGEGVYGLQRAFQLAGAKQLIVSLWEVSSPVSRYFMNEFYTQIAMGKTAVESFKLARQKTKTKSKYKVPFFWGPFVLVGVGAE